MVASSKSGRGKNPKLQPLPALEMKIFWEKTRINLPQKNVTIVLYHGMFESFGYKTIYNKYKYVLVKAHLLTKCTC